MGNINSSEGVQLRFLDGCPEIPPAPTEDQVQLRFNELLLFACTDPELRDELNAAESIETKWAYAFLSKLPHGSVAEEWLDPRECVELVQRFRNDARCARDLFLAIRINIMLRPSSWVEKFVAESGIEELIAPLQVSGGTSVQTCNEVLSTLFVLANSSIGISALLKIPECCSLLYSIFDSSSSNEIKARSLKLLGVLSRESTMAHDSVLSAFSSKSPEDQSLQSLITKLEQNQSDIALQLAAVKFVNALLEATRDRKQRVSICEDLKTNGFLSLLEPFKNRDDDDGKPASSSLSVSMNAQVDMFFENYGEATKADKLGALRLALGDALSTNLNGLTRSSQISVGSDPTAGNQGENDEAGESTNPEQEQSGASDTSLSAPVNTTSTDLVTTEPKPKETEGPVKSKQANAMASSTPENSPLDNIFDQLQQSTRNLDPETSDKLTSLLQKLALTLSDESGARKAVDRLDKSFSSTSLNNLQTEPEAKLKEPAAVVKPGQEPDLLTRVGLAFFPSLGEPQASVTKPPTSGRPTLFSGFGDFSLPSLSATTPANNSVSRPSFTSFIGADGAASPWGRSTDSPAGKGLKLSLPFFQSSRKGPGLGVTPACTPIATASVRKDAKRPVFPSFPSPPRKEMPTVTTPAPPSTTATVPPPAPNLPSIDITPAILPLEVVKPLVIEPNRSSTSNAVEPPPVGIVDISKFRKLLSMGAPRDAVRAKMQQAGVNPDLLDEQQGFTPKASPKPAPSVEKPIFEAERVSKFRKLLPMGAPVEVVEARMREEGVDPNLLHQKVNLAESKAPSQPETSSGPDISKFKKLLSMGAPLAVVKAKMTQAGVDPALLDGPSTAAPPASSALSVPPAITKVKDDPQYAKFFKLLSMGAPAESVRAKMRMAGLQPELLDTPDAPLKPEPSASEAAASQPQVKVKEDPAYAKFFKLLSMGAPADSVKAKIRMAGLNPDLLDTPDAAMPTVNAPAAAPTAAVKVKDDPAYAKFFKLLSMGAPAESVKVKMKMAGLKPELLDTPDADMPNEDSQVCVQPQVKVKDDPAYAKFFKLLEMGAPAESVKAKMRMAGLQGDLLDTPDAFLPNAAAPSIQAAPSAPSTTAARRAHLSIAIKPVVKAKTRSFYWQHLKAEAIKGTIWEELEKEHSNESNQDFLTLTESELEVLETEFPPPAACGPGTGTRRGGSMSGIGSPGGPASPLASPRVVFLIDRARSNNISIIVKQFRMSNAALRMAIMKMDSEVLTLDRVQGLIKILPTEEEIAAISGFSGDPTTLNGAELVLKELITVPRLKQRLSALETKHQFPALVRDLQTKINKIRVTSNEIAQSSELKTFLLVILQVGNKMNHGTPRAGAKGFRLNDLTKLVQLKSTDKSVTLLHYVARMVRMKKGNVVRLSDSLASLYDVQSIPIPELQGDMNRINDITESINVELAAQRLKNRIEEKEENDLFVESMTVFVDEATKEVTSLKKDLDETLRLMRDVMLRFDKNADEEEAPAPDAPLTPAMLTGAGEFFSIVYEFTMSLMKADRENELKRVRDEKRLKQQELKNATPRRSAVLTKSNTKAAGPETLETPQRKSLIAVPSSASSKCEIVSSASNNAVTAAADDATKSRAESESSTPPTVDNPIKTPESDADKSKLTTPLSSGLLKPNEAHTVASTIEEAQPEKANVDATLEEKPVPKPPSIPKTVLKIPDKIIKASALPIVPASPLKKVVGVFPTAIPSPMKLKRTNSSASSTEKGTSPAVSFDATSLNEIKSQLKTKHVTNNEPQVLRVSKPEVEADGDDHDNNNSEPSSPEKALSEAEPSTPRSLLYSCEETPFTRAASRMPVPDKCVGFIALCVWNLYAVAESEFYTCSLTDEFEATIFMKDFARYENIATADTSRPGRRLATDALSLFRAVETKGLRGFLEGGVFSLSTPLTCAELCDVEPLCLSFDFETVSRDCYISHTDRYAHPEAFLDFPTGVYYEWQGDVDAPEIEPSGGLFSTQVVVRLLTAKLGAAIHYRIVSSAELEFTDLTAAGLFGSGQNVSVVASGDVITLPTYSCKVFVIAVKKGMGDSTLVVSDEFQIYPSKYVYLVPYFNGDFHGRVTRIELDLKGKKRPRPARFLEFSDYETPNGIGPYDDQVDVIDMATLDSAFKGFNSGFTAFSKARFVNETYLVPAADDPNYKVTAWKVVLKAQYNASATHSGFGTPAEIEQAVEYLYLVPFYNGTVYASKVLRVMALTFSSSAPIVETLDLDSVDKTLKGFGATFTHGSYGYLVPRENENGLFGKLVRFRVDKFDTTSVEMLDLAAINSRYVGFSSAITYGKYAYLVPFRRPLMGDELTMNLREFPVSNSGLVVRVDLSTFRVSGSLDLANIHPDLCGFSGAVTVTHFAYFVPYMRVKQPDSEELNPYSGLVARVDLRDFTAVQYLDLTAVNSGLRGFMRGFAYRQYVFLVPHRSLFFDHKGPTQSGKVARIDTNNFSPSGVSFLDLTTALRSQVPDFADSDLRGFKGGVVSGKINLDKFDEVQTLDLTQLDSKLRGFTDGILSKVQEPLEANLFDEFQIRLGTTDPYEYTY
ncbi:hypothetical protein PHYPSEUDO_014470 [Phytophthora pseudosyringae]|uniref:FH2 domain-containing protein n=1 Tax=Phytophthora pseudosyringae TaxID=221518 RepID=A0A8T1W1T6_9STRA|nr:hypothetical protein PHYPSEUDO_014470 [Phytophthora pseudosyringae]